MLKDVLLVLAADILVVDRLFALCIDPSDVSLAALQSSVEVLDQAKSEGQLEETFNAELSLCFHLPSGSSRAKWTDFSISSDNDDLVEVDKASELGKIGLRVVALGQFREGQGEVGSRSDVDLLLNGLSIAAGGDFEVSRVIHRNSSAGRSGLVYVVSDLGIEDVQVCDGAHTTVEVSPDRLDLRDIEHERVHETENVESHLFGRESTAAKLLDTSSDDIGSGHESSSSPGNVWLAMQTVK